MSWLRPADIGSERSNRPRVRTTLVGVKRFLVTELVNYKLVLPEGGVIRIDPALEVGLH